MEEQLHEITLNLSGDGGIFLNGERVYAFLEEYIIYGTQWYMVKARITCPALTITNGGVWEEKLSDKVTFWVQADLSTFWEKTTGPITDILGEHNMFNPDKFLDLMDPGFLKFLKDRVVKKCNLDPNILPFNYEEGDYCRGMECLEFTKDSASSWAGPFKLRDGRLGALAELKLKKKI